MRKRTKGKINVKEVLKEHFKNKSLIMKAQNWEQGNFAFQKEVIDP